MDTEPEHIQSKNAGVKAMQRGRVADADAVGRLGMQIASESATADTAGVAQVASGRHGRMNDASQGGASVGRGGKDPSDG